MVNESQTKLQRVKSADADVFTSSKWPQYLAATIASIGFFALGTAVAWSSPALPRLSLDPTFNLSGEQKTWLAALVPLGAVFGGPLGGYGIERYGRHRTLLMCSLPLTIGWILVALAHTVTLMSFGRFLTGICCGIVTLAMPIYVAEITEENIRGLASSSSAVLCASGLLMTYILGSLVSWQLLTLLSAAVPVIYSVCLLKMPESPVYLLSKGDKKGAVRALVWFRGAESKDQVEPELVKLQAGLNTSPAMTRSLGVSDYLTPEVLKPTIVCLVLMLLQQLSGINSVIFYTVDIFRAATGGNTDSEAMDPNTASIIIGLVFLLSIFLFSFLIEKIGRRVLLLWSGLMMTVSLACFGYFFYAKAANDPFIHADSITWLPLVSLLIFSVAFNIGFGPLPWIMMAELVPSSAKGFTSSLATAFNWSLAFLVTKSFENWNNTLGAHGTYWMFAVITGAGVAFTYMYVPETRGKGLEEIQEFFKEKKSTSESPNDERMRIRV